MLRYTALLTSTADLLISTTFVLCSNIPTACIIGVAFGISYVLVRKYLQPRRQNVVSPMTLRFADLKTCKSIVSGNILHHGSCLTFLESRAIPNKRLIDSFGIENSFTSTDEAYCKEFRGKAANLLKVKERDWKGLMTFAGKTIRDGLSIASHDGNNACIQLVPIVHTTVFRFMLLLMFPQKKTEIDTGAAAIVAEKINALWMTLKKTPASPCCEDRVILGRELWKIFPEADQTLRGNPLNLILPAYEDMWRVVLRCFIEVLYRGGNERQSWRQLLAEFAAYPTKSTFQAFDSGASVQHIVQETLRLYPPTKSIYRAVIPEEWDIWPDIIAADITAL